MSPADFRAARIAIADTDDACAGDRVRAGFTDADDLVLVRRADLERLESAAADATARAIRAEAEVRQLRTWDRDL